MSNKDKLKQFSKYLLWAVLLYCVAFTVASYAMPEPANYNCKGVK